jgi:hypothetical protein
VNNILREYLDNFVLVYLDNILIYSRDKSKYKKYIWKVLEALKAKDLKIKLEKYSFWVKKVDFLGFLVTTEGIKIDLSKVKAILE